MRLWIDDLRIPPEKHDWIWTKNVEEAKAVIYTYEHQMSDDMILIDLNADFVEILVWLKDMNIVDKGYAFKVHSTDFIARANIEKMILKNGWRLI